MSLDIKCARCIRLLDEPGGLLISPPIQERNWRSLTVEKLHLCVACWGILMRWVG